MKIRYSLAISSLIVPLLTAGCLKKEHTAQQGDIFQIDYSCYVQSDNALVETTQASMAGNEHINKSILFAWRDNYTPIQFKVPAPSNPIKATPFAPLEDKIAIAIANGLVGKTFTTQTTLTLESSLIDDMPPRERYLTLARQFSLPRLVDLSKDEFEQRYGKEFQPRQGLPVDEHSLYPGVIRSVTDSTISIYYSAKKGATAPFVWGMASLQEKDEDTFIAIMDVHLDQLVPRIGGIPGRIVKVEEEHFTIDFGLTFANETLMCDITANTTEIVPQNAWKGIDWQKDFNTGLRMARQQGKPVILYLYSESCPFCRQMDEEVLKNYSLNPYIGSFVWVKINSNKETYLAEKYHQQGFPTTLILNPVGQEMKRFAGAQNVTTFSYQLEEILKKKL